MQPLLDELARADLQDDKATEFNHPRLVPQFVPRLPAYKAEISPRLGVLVERRFPFSSWTTHLQQAYYDRTDIPGWTLEHPYDNPLAPLLRGLPPSDNSLRHLPQPWYKSGITEQDYPWVDLETSLQWQAFQRLVDVLQQRGNRVFVLVGPFNEHLLTPASLQRYQQVKATIAAWLEKTDSPCRSRRLAERAIRRRQPSAGGRIRDAGERARKEFLRPVVEASALGCGNRFGSFGVAAFTWLSRRLADRNEWNSVFIFSAAVMVVATVSWLLFDPTRPVALDDPA